MDHHGWEACQIAELMGHRELQELLIREGMSEKQAVMRDLPPAKWHSDIWHEVVRMQTIKKRDYLMESTKAEEEHSRIKQLQENARRSAQADYSSAGSSSISSNSSRKLLPSSVSTNGFKYKDKELKFFSS
jgi:hypothetical protein